MPFNWNQACCNKCNEQYSLEEWSIGDQRIRRDVTCPKCAENQRKCDLLTHQKELEKEKNERKRLEKQQTLELEREKRVTLREQQQHDREEGEKKRRHEIEIETKKSETIMAKTKIKEENDVKKLQHKAAMQAKQHKHEIEMQDKRHEEKHLEIRRLETLERVLELQLSLKESSGSAVDLRNFSSEHCRFPLQVQINDSH